MFVRIQDLDDATSDLGGMISRMELMSAPAGSLRPRAFPVAYSDGADAVLIDDVGDCDHAADLIAAATLSGALARGSSTLHVTLGTDGSEVSPTLRTDEWVSRIASAGFLAMGNDSNLIAMSADDRLASAYADGGCSVSILAEAATIGFIAGDAAYRAIASDVSEYVPQSWASRMTCPAAETAAFASAVLGDMADDVTGALVLPGELGCVKAPFPCVYPGMADLPVHSRMDRSAPRLAWLLDAMSMLRLATLAAREHGNLPLLTCDAVCDYVSAIASGVDGRDAISALSVGVIRRLRVDIACRGRVPLYSSSHSASMRPISSIGGRSPRSNMSGFPPHSTVNVMASRSTSYVASIMNRPSVRSSTLTCRTSDGSMACTASITSNIW